MHPRNFFFVYLRLIPDSTSAALYVPKKTNAVACPYSPNVKSLKLQC